MPLRSRVQALESEIDQLVAAHPDAAFILSLPGMGAALTAEFLSIVGTVGRFTSGDALAAAVGPAPVLQQSGKVRYSRGATGGDKALKRVLYQSAFCALGDPASRPYYDRKRSEGKRHHQALIALARRRVNVLYAMLRNRQPYQTRPPLRLVA
ncbi:transposase [Streptomyces sp. NPDC002619]|uniref:transposase n=1 Tax=Streptomyces sp. NPDC002619 TaxID=3364655 RepID=UPI0036CEE656